MHQLECSQTACAPSPFATYIREIDQTALLNAEQERQLAYRIGEGDTEARDHMVRANLRLVVKIARAYNGKGLPLEDLIAEGNLGLVRAVEGFDPELGVRFSTYASYWVKQSIKRALVNTGKTIRIPNYMVDLMTKWRREVGRLKEELGRTPTEEEVAVSLKVSAKKLKIIKKAIRVYNSGPQAGPADSEWSLDEMALDDVARAPGADVARTEELHQVLGLLDQLEEREAIVLRLRFGLAGEEPMTLKEVGDRIGYTRERVRQIEREALGKLRDCLQES
jgi:RNA polymerase primary sigma factor